MSKPNRVFIRTYCECDCDCPTCHTGEKPYGGKVEKCVYCQLKWANKGQYNLDWRRRQGWGDPNEHPGYQPSPKKRIEVDGHWYQLEES